MGYQVVGECAHVEVQELGGARSVHMLYKGAPVPDGVSEARLAHLLLNGLIADTGDQPVAPNAAVQQDPARGLDSVTVDLLRGEKPEDPRQDPALAAGERVQETVTGEGAIVKAAEPDADTDAEVNVRRTAAREKLAALNGEAPDGRASKDVLVEYLVGKGYDFSELSKREPAELKALVKQQS